jgi:L-2-aminoadipate reductase
MLKGCVQLRSRPAISNTINQVPVNHVSRVVVAASFNPPEEPLGVAQITSHPRITFAQFLGSLSAYGYNVPESSYADWKKRMEAYVAGTGEFQDVKEEHALLPLYHFVTGDLPGDTKAPELDDKNAAEALKRDAAWTGQDWSTGGAVTESTVGVYLAYLVELAFMPRPDGVGDKKLPDLKVSEAVREGMKRVGGRRGVA